MSFIKIFHKTCYGCGRTLGWALKAENIVTGHPEKAAKHLVNKAIGRKLVSKLYFK